MNCLIIWLESDRVKTVISNISGATGQSGSTEQVFLK